jgi:hypothetical protein
MTEIPAKTPRPIGRTDSFFPGVEKASVAELDASAAAADTEAVETAPETPDTEIPAVGVGTALVATDEAGPLATAPPAEPVTAAEEAELDAELEAELGADTGDEIEPEEAPALVAADVGAAVPVVSPTTDIAPFPPSPPLGVAETVASVLVAEGATVSTVEKLDVDAEAPPPADPLFVPAGVNLHRLTCSTASSPLSFLIGVKVITQVSVIGPEGVVVW